MIGELAGRRAFVSGGSSGIGAAVVRAFAEAGAAVAIGGSRRARQAEEESRRIAGQGGRAFVVQADLSDRAQTERAADEVLSGFDGALDVFVHCAGIDVTETAPTHLTPDETWERMLAIHLTAAFRLSKRLIPAMLNGRGPSVIFVGSVAGIVAWEGDVAYNVARPGCTIWPAASRPITPKQACAPM